MPDNLRFEGFIKNVSYRACVTKRDISGVELPTYDLEEFDANAVRTSGLIRTQTGEGSLGYSKWVSPKRTRSYPFERIYNTYNAPKIITIIPIIKDEGADGDLDKIGYMTFSWMNLLNIYIVLAYYESAEKNRSIKQQNKRKLTRQKFNSRFVSDQIAEIIEYKQSALHWNKNLFESRFTSIFNTALDAYAEISQTTGVALHRQQELRMYLEEIKRDYSNFMSFSHAGSERARSRESQTLHRLEHLAEGHKAEFFIQNYLGGVYYLTADEVFLDGSTYVIQESKNSTNGVLPSLADIRDGLFKLILFSNLDWLSLEGTKVKFAPRLKLTGKKVLGNIRLPSSEVVLQQFLEKNKRKVTKTQNKVVQALSKEVQANRNLTIEIASNRKHATR